MKKLQIGLLLLLPYAAYCADAYIGLGETTIVKICDGDYDPDTTYSWSVSSGLSKVTLTGSDNCYRTVEGVATGDATIDVSGCGSFDISVVEVEFGTFYREVADHSSTFPQGVLFNQTDEGLATIDPPLPSGVDVVLSIEGSGAGNGAFNITSPSNSTITGSGDSLDFSGGSMTNQGNGGGLTIVAKIDGNIVGRSPALSVYPFVTSWDEQLSGSYTSHGGSITMTWGSDSGDLSDLNKVFFRETLDDESPDNDDPPWGISAQDPPIPMAMTNGFTGDQFWTTPTAFEPAGSYVIDQSYEFEERRSGSGWLAFYYTTVEWELTLDAQGNGTVTFSRSSPYSNLSNSKPL